MSTEIDSKPTVEAAAPSGGNIEPCPTCAAPLAADQRYCLECGTRRAHLPGVLGGAPHDPRASAAASVPAQALPAPAPAAPAPRGSGATVILAGVGVLLLAMGIGVLIGRAGSSPSKASATPQVISVAPSGASAGPTSGAATTITPPVAAAKRAHSSAAPAKQSKSSGSEGVGQVPTKPAPPSVLQNLHGGSGQSYEQKSKSLPNVVSTG